MSKYFINKYIKYNNLVVNIANKIQTFNCFRYYYLKQLFKDMLKFHGSWSHSAFVIIEAVFSQQVLWFGLIPLIKGIRFPSVVSQQAALGMAYHWAKNQSGFSTCSKNTHKSLTDTGEMVQKWTRVFSALRWVILVARTRRKKKKKNACPLLNVFACGQVSSPRLYRFSLE